MNLSLMAPPIQDDVLHLEVLPGRELISERNLRKVLKSLVWEAPVAALCDIFERISKKMRLLDS